VSHGIFDQQAGLVSRSETATELIEHAELGRGKQGLHGLRPSLRRRGVLAAADVAHEVQHPLRFVRRGSTAQDRTEHRFDAHRRVVILRYNPVGGQLRLLFHKWAVEQEQGLSRDVCFRPPASNDVRIGEIEYGQERRELVPHNWQIHAPLCSLSDPATRPLIAVIDCQPTEPLDRRLARRVI
jgi:hypothetical protein